MTKKQKKGVNRREFLRTGARGALLAATAAVGGALAGRASAQSCINEGRCRACGLFTECSLDDAQVLRSELETLRDAG